MAEETSVPTDTEIRTAFEELNRALVKVVASNHPEALHLSQHIYKLAAQVAGAIRKVQKTIDAASPKPVVKKPKL